MVKKGDTLIEVMLAVGIFSMIAISVAAVMSNGTSGAQNALESTIAREEIDTQAEALRFIQSAYIADKNSNNQRFVKLWEEITQNALEIGSLPSESDKDILNFAPLDCRSLYGDDGEVAKHAFIINPRMLSSFSEKDIDQVYVKANPNETDAKFFTASTYPRLIFGQSDTDQGQLIDDPISTNDTLFSAEGIYVIAVKDADTTKIVGTPTSDSKTSAFYDFYIRTCWYGDNSDEPSTISTLIRLYDPDALPSLPSEPEDPVNPPTPTTIANIDFMQQVTREIFNNTPNRTEATLKDERTGYEYQVVKIDNQLWVREPLRIPPDFPLTKDLSAIANDSWTIKSRTGSYSFNTPLIHNGPFYNFCAVSGGAPGGCTGNEHYTNKRISICPKGWSLPSVADFEQVLSKDSKIIENPLRDYWTSTNVSDNLFGSTTRMTTYDISRKISLSPLKVNYWTFTCIWE